MALDAIVESMDKVAEGLREHYKEVEGGGSFVLDVIAVKGTELADTQGLKKALERERSNVKSAQTKLKTFDGIDPKEAREALGKMDEMADWDPDKKLEEAVQAREKQLVKRHEDEKKTLNSRVENLREQLSDNLIKATATKAIAEAKGSVELLLPHVMRQTKMRETDDGKLIAEVVDEAGHQRVGDSTGNPMTIPQLVDELKKDSTFSRAFDATGASGSGAGGAGRGGGGAGSGGVSSTKTVSRGDQDAMNANIEGIASGKVTIID